MVRKEDSNEYYEPSSLRSLMASFEWYLKKKNYEISIMKDAEFEQVRELSTVSECSMTIVHSAGSATGYQQRPASNVNLYRCCYLWWSIQHLYQQPLSISPTPAAPATEIKSRKKYKRLNVLDSDSELKPCVGLKANVSQYFQKLFNCLT